MPPNFETARKHSKQRQVEDERLYFKKKSKAGFGIKMSTSIITEGGLHQWEYIENIKGRKY